MKEEVKNDKMDSGGEMKEWTKKKKRSKTERNQD